MKFLPAASAGSGQGAGAAADSDAEEVVAVESTGALVMELDGNLVVPVLLVDGDRGGIELAQGPLDGGGRSAEFALHTVTGSLAFERPLGTRRAESIFRLVPVAEVADDVPG